MSSGAVEVTDEVRHKKIALDAASTTWPVRGTSESVVTRPSRSRLELSYRLRVFGCVAAVALVAGAAVETSGALDGLERGTLNTRFELRGTERPDDVVVVGIDAKTFEELGRQWPFPRSLHGRAIRRLHAAGAREIVYDVQFTEPTRPSEDLALFDAIAAVGGAVLARSETDGRGNTNVLGGDANLRRAHARAAASDLGNDGAGAVSHVPREVSGLESMSVAVRSAPGSRCRPRHLPGAMPGSTTEDRPARSAPSRSPTSCGATSHPERSVTESRSSVHPRRRFVTCTRHPSGAAT